MLQIDLSSDDVANYVNMNMRFKQEAQLMLTNPRDAFRGQSRSKMVPFDRPGMVSY